MAERMKKKELNYFFAAEEDYIALQALFNNHIISNVCGYLSEQCCEKYLKHVICLEADVGAEEKYMIPLAKEKLHSLMALCGTLHQIYGIKTDYNFRQSIYALTYLYSTTRYPNSEFYHAITEDELAICKKTVEDCRNFVLNYMKLKEESLIS